MQLISIVYWALTWNVPLIASQGCPESWNGYGNSCYLLQIFPMSWQRSRDNCKRHGADLVSILSSSEVDFIYRQMGVLGNFRFWIGLYRNKKTSDPKEGWVWSDGNNFTNPQQWSPRQPDNYLNEEDCAECLSRTMRWNDNNCARLYYSICKRGKGNLSARQHIFLKK